MTNASSKLLWALSDDLSLQRAYANDKEEIMRKFGLSPAEIAAFRSGDEAKIKKTLGGDETTCFIIGLASSSSSA
jgi:hypothetical protein